MAFITLEQFDSVLDVAIHLPATLVQANTALVVASIGITQAKPIEVTLRWLQLRMLNGNGSATLGLFLNYNVQASPSTQSPIELIEVTSTGTGADCSNVLDSPQFQERDFTTELTLNVASPGPGTYSWVVWTDNDCTVMVNGSARVNANP